MTQQSWLGRLVARVMHTCDRSGWRSRRFVRLSLQKLPDRDGPSSVAVVAECLLLGTNSGDECRTPPLDKTDCGTSTSNSSNWVQSPLPTVTHGWSFLANSCVEATSTNPTVERSNSLAAFGPLWPEDDLVSLATVEVGTPEQRSRFEFSTIKSVSSSDSQRPAEQPTPIIPAESAESTRPTDVPAFATWVPVTKHVQQKVIPAEVRTPPTEDVFTAEDLSTESHSFDAIENPATFIDGEEPVDDLLASDDVTDAEINDTSRMNLDEQASLASQQGSSGQHCEVETTGSSNVTVRPEPGAIGRPAEADSGVFRISAVSLPSTGLEVRYTLAAHNARGSITIERSVSLPSGSITSIVTPGPVLASSQPQVLTIALHDEVGHSPAQASATLFLASRGERIGDSALFEAHRVGGSQEAFEALVQRHGPSVLRTCERIVGNRADAEDITQFVFLQLARWQGQFPGTLTGWLRAVSKNASLSLLRSKQRRRRYEREAAKPVSVEPSEASTLDETLQAAIRQLPALLEEAVRLRYLEGHSQQEAAQIVGCPRGTLSRRAAHGIRVLRELLTDVRVLTG